jgi:hypothetical protein
VTGPEEDALVIIAVGADAAKLDFVSVTPNEEEWWVDVKFDPGKLPTVTNKYSFTLILDGYEGQYKEY